MDKDMDTFKDRDKHTKIYQDIDTTNYKHKSMTIYKGPVTKSTIWNSSRTKKLFTTISKISNATN